MTHFMAETTPKVLIVEDDDDWRGLLVMVIKRLGYEVFEAATGLEAIERASAVLPHLILMDIGLPGMTGDKATACLKANPVTKHIPIVVQTAWHDSKHTERALEAGAAEILYKPVAIKIILDVLHKYLSAGHKGTSAAAA
jgi:CheY-like chemotaxis protein